MSFIETVRAQQSQSVDINHIGNENSGRYPRGSGKNPFQHTDQGKFLAERAALAKKGYTDTEIARKMGMTTTKYRKEVNIAREEERRTLRPYVKSLSEKGMSVDDIAREVGKSYSWTRNAILFDETAENTRKQTSDVASLLIDKVGPKSYLDVSRGVENQLGISQVKLRNAVEYAVNTGDYEVLTYRIRQITSKDNDTPMNVLVPKGTTWDDVAKHTERVRTVDFSLDGQSSTKIQKLQTPTSLDWDRVGIRYAVPKGQPGHGIADKDGALMDGVMLLRPGTKDLNLGDKSYAQVRIAVGGTHYLKGMAMYGDPKDFPKGVDVLFNTNKTKDIAKKDVLKELNGALDGDNPFGANIKRQSPLLGKNGKPVVNEELTKHYEKKFGKKLDQPIYKNSAVNIVNEEGDWLSWSKTLSAQFLSKQPPHVVKERLQATLNKNRKEIDEINKVTNPVIKQQLLASYASGLESAQAHLKAAAPKGYQPHVILPLPKLKPTEIYAPNYKDGDKVMLLRYPHAGRFELAELTVNNRGVGKKQLGKVVDAVGIHPSVAQILSGADFDGDTVGVIPNNGGRFKSQKILAGLKDFDPNIYADKPGTFKPLTKGASTNKQMGMVSNLITDMTLKGASDEELAKAVRHSMVVIDSAKHKLNYARSAKENDINALKRKYMGHVDKMDYASYSRFNDKTRKIDTIPVHLNEDLYRKVKEGKVLTSASTIISRSKNNKVTTGGYFKSVKDPKTGEEKVVLRAKKETQLIKMVKDARDFLTPTSDVREKLYADYVNSLKSMKTEVDSMSAAVKVKPWDRKAAKIYSHEVTSLNTKLDVSLKNAPRERQAQMLAARNVKLYLSKLPANEQLDKGELKKLKQKAITAARDEVGAQRNPVKITPEEWDAIQANAISNTMLRKLVRNMNDDELKELATPRSRTSLSDASIAKAKALLDNGNTFSAVAEQLGISTATLHRLVKGG